MTPSEQTWNFERPLLRHGVALTLALLAFALRMLHLDAQPLWFDEALSLHIATAADGMHFIHNTAPLYHALTRLWCGWFGSEVEGLRSLSAVAGALFVWASFHTAREAFGDRAAVASAAVALSSPLHLYYSQEARAYSLLISCLMVVLWMLWRLARGWSLGAWCTLVVASAAAMFTHYLAAIPLAIGYVAIGCVRRDAERPAPIRPVLAAGVVAVLMVVPWFFWWRRHTPFDPSDMQWLVLLWQQLSVPGALGWSLEMFLLGGQQGHAPIFLKQLSTVTFPELLRVGALLAGSALAIAAAYGFRRRPRGQRVAMLQGAALLFGPLLALLLISMVRPVYCPARYDLIAFPGFVLLCGPVIAGALAATTRAGRLLAFGLVAVLLVAVVVKDIAYFEAAPGKEPSRLVAEYLIANVPPDEIAIVCGEVALPVLARVEQRGFVWSEGRCRREVPAQQFGLRMLPLGLEEAPGAVSRYLRAMADGTMVTDLTLLVRDTSATGLWFVLSDDLRNVRSAAVEQVGRQLFARMKDAGFTMVGGDRELGVVHLTRQH